MLSMRFCLTDMGKPYVLGYSVGLGVLETPAIMMMLRTPVVDLVSLLLGCTDETGIAAFHLPIEPRWCCFCTQVGDVSNRHNLGPHSPPQVGNDDGRPIVFKSAVHSQLPDEANGALHPWLFVIAVRSNSLEVEPARHEASSFWADEMRRHRIDRN
jgi:hypothetical protein